MTLINIHAQEHIGHQFGVGRAPKDITIDTPRGKHTFTAANTSRKDALNELKSGGNTLGQITSHWKDLSHRTKGLDASWFKLPVEYRGASLTQLNKMVDAFNNSD